MMPLFGLPVYESANLPADVLLVTGGALWVPTNRTGWTFGWYMRVLLCGDIQWEAVR